MLAQGDTPVNGPHQGAWVTTSGGEDWFMHFQDQEAYGRVVHLQPMRWRDDGWPVMGVDDGNGLGSPVLVHAKPRVGGPVLVTAPATSDDLTAPELGRQWVWQANADRDWWSLRRHRLTLACWPNPNTEDLRLLGNVLGQRFPAESFAATTSMALATTTPGARAGLVVLGATYAWIGLRHDRRHGLHPVQLLLLHPRPGRERARPPAHLRGSTVEHRHLRARTVQNCRRARVTRTLARPTRR